MNFLSVGDKVEEYHNYREGAKFDLDDNGAMLVVYFVNPTAEEIEQFKANKPFHIRFTKLDGIIFLTVKIGGLSWMDAPYSPHLSKNLTRYVLPDEGQGLALTLIFIDSGTGEIKSMRLIGLSHQFTKQLFGNVMEEAVKEFDYKEYDRKLRQIYQKYTTEQICKMSNYYCKINS